MKTPKNALLLVGSAKPAGESSSEAIGSRLLDQLSAQGITSEIHYVARILRTEARFQDFLVALDHTDLLILAFPLYVDSLPYLVIDALERIAAHRRTQDSPAQTAFVAIANCGFPESQHNATALAICEQFAMETGFDWAGGLAIGAGGAIGGRPLTEAGGLLRQVIAALDEIAAALAQGNPAPPDAVDRLGRPFLPKLAYMLMGDLGWLGEARRYHTLTKLQAQPFQQHE